MYDLSQRTRDVPGHTVHASAGALDASVLLPHGSGRTAQVPGRTRAVAGGVPDVRALVHDASRLMRDVSCLAGDLSTRSDDPSAVVAPAQALVASVPHRRRQRSGRIEAPRVLVTHTSVLGPGAGGVAADTEGVEHHLPGLPGAAPLVSGHALPLLADVPRLLPDGATRAPPVTTRMPDTAVLPADVSPIHDGMALHIAPAWLLTRHACTITADG